MGELPKTMHKQTVVVEEPITVEALLLEHGMESKYFFVCDSSLKVMQPNDVVKGEVHIIPRIVGGCHARSDRY